MDTFETLMLPLRGRGVQGQGIWLQNPFCTNIVMLHIKSKVMKSRIQWCNNFAPGACLGSKNRIFGSFSLIATHL